MKQHNRAATRGNIFLEVLEVRELEVDVQLLSAHIPVLVVCCGYEQPPGLEHLIGGECEDSALSFHPSPQGNHIILIGD